MPLEPNASLKSMLDLQISIEIHFIFSLEYPGPCISNCEELPALLPRPFLHLWKREQDLFLFILSILKGLH